MRHRLAIACLCLFGACTPPQSAEQVVYTLESTYDAAINVAVAYASLPRCAQGGPALCSEPDLVARTNDAAHQAWLAIQAAEAAVRAAKPDATTVSQALALANAALAALQNITANMKVS